MVVKLMKHELRALFRGLLVLDIVCVLLAAIGRLLIAVDREGVFGIVFSVCAVWLSMFMVVAAYLASVAQFSRSLYTGEGYLTFSIPVSTTKLIVSKMLSAIVAMLFGLAVAFASSAIVLSGVPETARWLFSIGELIFDAMHNYFSADPMLAVEAVLQTLASVPMWLLLFYLLTSVGQLFSKHRKLFTFLIAVGFLAVALPVLGVYCFDPILEAAATVSPHLSNWIGIVFYLGVDFGAFFLVRYILIHKVNLIV